MDSSSNQTLDRVVHSLDASTPSATGAHEYIAHITLGLQTANSTNDSDQLAALLVHLPRHAPAIGHLQPDLHNVLHLIQLTVQALPCCKSNLQVQLEATLAMYTQLCELNSPLHNAHRHNKQGVRCCALWGKQQMVLNSLRLIRCARYRVCADSCRLFKHTTHWP